MGKKKPEKPTRAQKILISNNGLLPDNWLVLDEDNLSLTLISKWGRRRVILK